MRATHVDARLEAIAGPLVTSWRNGQPRQVVQVPAGATIIALIGAPSGKWTFLWERVDPTLWYLYMQTAGAIRHQINGKITDRLTTTGWHTVVNDTDSTFGIGGRATVATTPWDQTATAGIVVTHATLTPHQAKQAAIWLATRLNVPLPPQL